MKDPYPFSEAELNILNHLADAWKDFIELEPQHPDETIIVAENINNIKMLISMRGMRRVRPDLFP